MIPGLSPYRPVWTAAGVIAGELLLLVIASFPLRRVIGAKSWRRLHWATYAMFALAAVHGIGSGTDTSRPWVMAFYAGTIGAVAAATVWRALVPPPRRVPQAAREHIPERTRRSTPMSTYRIVIDRALCSGFGACAEHAPDSSSSTALASPRARRRNGRRGILDAAAACPMGAIAVFARERRTGGLR